MTIVNGTEQINEVHMARERRELPPTKPTIQFRWMGVLDRTVAALLLVPGLPLMAALVVLVRLTSRGPGVFEQKRVGKGGRTFTMFKLRSMRVDAEHRSGAIWAKDDDPRTTAIGKYLRKFHLDELPQLFNVLRGEMSLVGPRPERPEFVRVLAAALPGYEDRLLVLPGVTGLAQINLSPDTDLDSVAKKLALDLEYVETAGAWLDLRLVVVTIARMFKIGSKFWVRLFGTERDLKNHSKYVRPDQSQIRPNGSPLSANELANRIAERLGDTIDDQLAATLEDTIAEGNGNGRHDSSGNGNGHAKRKKSSMPALSAKPR